jgi:hypothetical protein
METIKHESDLTVANCPLGIGYLLVERLYILYAIKIKSQLFTVKFFPVLKLIFIFVRILKCVIPMLNELGRLDCYK